MENSLLKYPLSNWDTLPANPVLPPDWAGNETHESPASRGAVQKFIEYLPFREKK